jgi:hypothetical protein
MPPRIRLSAVAIIEPSTPFVGRWPIETIIDHIAASSRRILGCSSRVPHRPDWQAAQPGSPSLRIPAQLDVVPTHRTFVRRLYGTFHSALLPISGRDSNPLYAVEKRTVDDEMAKLP